jgi:hypothetical protein
MPAMPRSLPSVYAKQSRRETIYGFLVGQGLVAAEAQGLVHHIAAGDVSVDFQPHPSLRHHRAETRADWVELHNTNL